MIATTTPHETVSGEQQNDIILEQSESYYGYLGEDGEGCHHHVDEATNTGSVPPDRAARFCLDKTGLYWLRVRGDPEHSEELEHDEDRDRWIAYVDSVRGWTDRPVHLEVTESFAAMHEGDRR